MCGETRIPRDMCAGNTKLGETRITVTLAEPSIHAGPTGRPPVANRHEAVVLVVITKHSIVVTMKRSSIEKIFHGVGVRKL